MVWNAIICCIIIAVFAAFLEQSVLNPLTIFTALWAALLFFQSLGLYALYTTDDEIYAIMIAGIVSFAVGYLIFRFAKTRIKVRLGTKSNRFISSDISVDYILKKKYVYMACLICIFFYLLDLATLINPLISGGLAAVRAICQDANGIIYTRRSGIESAIRTLFVGPFSFALLPITAVNVCRKDRNKKLIILCVIIIALRVFTEGGRVVIAYFMLHVLLAFYLQGRKNYLKNALRNIVDKNRVLMNIHKRRKLMALAIIVLIAVGCYLLYITTLSRSGDYAAIHMYFYVAMQGQMFQVWSKIVDQSQLYGYGLASLNGFLYPIIYIVKNMFGFSDFPGYWGKIVNMIQSTDSQWQWMSGYGRANAFVSLFWFFYLDGRVFGVILGMFIYGIVSAVAYKSVIFKTNDKNLCWYLMIMQGIIFSMVRLQFSNVMYAYSFIYILLLYKKRYVR